MKCLTDVYGEPNVASPGEKSRKVREGVHAWFITMCTTYACTVCPHE